MHVSALIIFKHFGCLIKLSICTPLQTGPQAEQLHEPNFAPKLLLKLSLIISAVASKFMTPKWRKKSWQETADYLFIYHKPQEIPYVVILPYAHLSYRPIKL